MKVLVYGSGVIRYSFTQCPNAEFAKRHHMDDVLPVMCNCDHLAMQKLHACLIREGTCVESPCCDYCIVGDRHPIAQEYPEVGKVYPLKKYGYNIKSQLLKLLVIFPAASAITAWICSLLG